MKITIESTDVVTVVDTKGTESRVWKGVTESGVSCLVFVAFTAFDSAYAASAAGMQDMRLSDLERRDIGAVLDDHFGKNETPIAYRISR